MKNISYAFIVVLLSVASQYAYSAPGWYVGKVSRVALTGSDGSFIVTFKNTALDDCAYKYAYFTGSKLGAGRLKHAYTMALTSVTSGLSMGIVIDKAINGPGGQCDAMGMTADLRAN